MRIDMIAMYKYPVFKGWMSLSKVSMSIPGMIDGFGWMSLSWYEPKKEDQQDY